MYIEMRPIKKINGFNTRWFCINPEHHQLPYALSANAIREAETLANNCNDICIAIVHDDQREYVLAGTIPGEWFPKIKLYNAEEVEEEADVHVYVCDMATGEVLWDRFVRYQPGKSV